jgi:hypothetical protein
VEASRVLRKNFVRTPQPSTQKGARAGFVSTREKQMIFMVRQQRAFVCPEVPKDAAKKAEAFAQASQGIKAPPKKKQAHYKKPRGGSRGRFR